MALFLTTKIYKELRLPSRFFGLGVGMGMTGAGGAPSSDVESKHKHELRRFTVGCYCSIYTRNLVTAKSRTHNQNIIVQLAKLTNHLLHAHNKH